jgi:hypothetical protein
MYRFNGKYFTDVGQRWRTLAFGPLFIPKYVRPFLLRGAVYWLDLRKLIHFFRHVGSISINPMISNYFILYVLGTWRASQRKNPVRGFFPRDFLLEISKKV